MKRPMKKHLAPLAACAAAALLPSCILYSHTADRLRDPGTTYTGVNIYQPVDGKIHYAPEKKQQGSITEGYVIANEVTFHKHSRSVNTDHWYPLEPLAGDYKPTGRQVVARITSSGFAEELDALPGGLMSIEAPKGNITQADSGVLSQWHPEGKAIFDHLGRTAAPVTTQPGWWRRRAIDCCDYFVDPLMTVVYNTALFGVVLPAGIVLTPVTAPVQLLCIQQQQKQDTSPAENQEGNRAQKK